MYTLDTTPQFDADIQKLDASIALNFEKDQVARTKSKIATIRSESLFNNLHLIAFDSDYESASTRAGACLLFLLHDSFLSWFGKWAQYG